MNIDLLLLGGGLVVLYFGAEWLVTGASKMAFALGVTPLIIGLTVVAYGTSAPELVVTAAASYRGNGGLSLGNIVGSNVCNIALVLGAAAVIRPVYVDESTLRRDYPLMVLASVALYVTALVGEWIGRFDGAVLFTGMVAYTVLTIRRARAEMRRKREDDDTEEPEKQTIALHAGLILLGLVGLVLGAEMMVTGAINVARDLGVEEFVIAVSVVAFGTSLPELATSVVAAFKDESDISVGNVIGSNLCNILWIIGLVGVVFELPVDERSLTFDFPIMLGFTFALYPIMRTGFRIGRGKGVLLLVGYAMYVVGLFVVR